MVIRSLSPLSIPNHNGVFLEVYILNPSAKRLHEPQSTTVKYLSYQGRGARQITEEEQQCAKGLIPAGCAKFFTHCELGKEGIDLV